MAGTAGDNSALSTPSSPQGDEVRTLDRVGGGGPKTQSVQMDVGGPSTFTQNGATIQNPESLVSITNRLPLDLTAQLFAETWDGPYIDQVNKWIISSGGSGVPTTLNPGGLALDDGSCTLSSGSIAGGWSALQSIPFFSPTDPGFLFSKHNNNFEFPLLTTGYRFWGFGIRQGVPVIGAALVDAAGWEISTGGLLYAVCYASGNRQQVAQVTVPVDSNPHKYFMYFRGDLAYWCYDTLNNVVATMPTGALGPNINTLPWLSLCISNGGTAVTLTNNGTQVSDTAHNTMVLADGAFGFRKATIKAPNIQPTSADTALVVGLSPSSAAMLDPNGGLGSMAQLLQINTMILAQLRVMNLQLAQMTGVNISADDLIDLNTLQ